MQEPLFPYGALSIEIKWSRPKPYSYFLEKESKNSKTHQLFLIYSQYDSEPPRFSIIGQTYAQPFAKLITTQNFKGWFETIFAGYQFSSLYVNFGNVVVGKGRRLDQQLVEEVVYILNNTVSVINSPYAPSYPLHNHMLGSCYIKNSGSRCMLPYKIWLGAFVDPGVKTRRKNFWG